MIISVHHYELAALAAPSDVHEAVAEAVDRELFESIPGLVEYRIGRGIKGDRAGEFAAVWTYESKDAWIDLWGLPDDPVPTSEYPEAWLVWEDELLAPVLAGDPDKVRYTSYHVIASGGGS